MKILVIRFSSLGDIILTKAIVDQLIIRYPKAEIDYLTKPIFKPLILAYFPVKTVFTEYKSISQLNQLRKREYSLVVDLHNKFNSWFSKTIIHGEKTVSYNKKRRLRQRIVAHKTSEAINSTVDLYNSIFDQLRAPYSFIEPQFQIKNDNSVNLLPDKSRLNVVIFPGATHNTKRIPKQKIISFINDYEHANTRFYLLGSKGENDLIQEITAELTKPATNLAGKFNLTELIAALNEADIVITNDSGPMHIAAALHKPQIAFFGSTNVSLGFRPLNDLAIVITNPIECSPCTLHGQKECPLKHFKCMNNIPVESIYQAYLELKKKL